MEESIAKLVVNKLDALYGVKEKYTEEELYTAFVEASKKPHYADEKVQKVAERMRKKLITNNYTLVKTAVENKE
jgi:transcriptional regulator NrdR family protein